MVAPQILSKTFQFALGGLSLVDRYFGNTVFDPDNYVERTPYELISELRKRGDIVRTYALNGWFVMNHEDVNTLLRDDRLSSKISDNKFISTVIRTMAGTNHVPLLDEPPMLLVDAPDHTRLRRLAAKGFTNRYIQSLTPTIEHLVDELLDKVPGEELDIIEHLAKPLPAIVIAEMLGVPAEERHLFEYWSEELLNILELGDHKQVRRGVKADIEMREYLKKLVAEKKKNRGQDLLTAFIDAEEDGDKLNEEELYAMCVLLLTAGHETTTRLIGNCLHCLMNHPAQLEAVIDDNKLLAGAIEEALRFEPPVNMVSRTAKENLEFKGTRIKKGQLVILSIAAANRDPGLHEDPEVFDIHRKNTSHVSFGHGIHLCIGMPLARVESQIALSKLFARYKTFKLREPPKWQPNPFFRGVDTLKVHAE